MMNKKNIAIYLSGVKSLAGGGGVERFFSDFFKIYSNGNNRQFELFYFLDQSTYSAILEVGKLDENIKNVVLLKNASNRFKKQIENADLYFKVKKHKIDIFHCANYGRQDFNKLMFLRKLKKGPKLIQNIVDCSIPYELIRKNAKYYERYVSQPNSIKFDGVFSWYEYYKSYFIENNLLSPLPFIFCIDSRFVLFKDLTEPVAKKDVFIFASRLDVNKKPSWFIKAIKHLVDRDKVNWTKWNFELYGNGPLEDELRQLSIDLGLAKIISFKKSDTMHKVFPQTKVYISTQEFENFPSLSMMEAMYHKNIIIARNVGQTSLLVNNNYNGFVMDEDSPLGLCVKMEEVISKDTEGQNKLMNNSRRMIDEIHTPDAFILQIENFWTELLNDKK